MVESPANEFALTSYGLEKWTAVYDRLTITPQAGGLKRLAFDCGSVTVSEIFLTREQAAHLAALLVDSEAAA